MNQKLLITLFISIHLSQFLLAQMETYTVKVASFSSDKYDEFSPVFYKNGVVFCTNRKAGSLTNYSNSQGKASFDINYIDTTQKVTWSKGEIFSKELMTVLNEGPVAFSKNRDTIYYARNLRVEGSLKELNGMGNKLGLFSAVNRGDKWVEIKEFRFNSEWYNITSPYLTSDGLKLYFASDRPDSYGGSDIYYCQWKNGYWDEPVNLGPTVNTKGNESHPYLNDAGEFFFSSDGHQGFGGKDIFVTKQLVSGWYPPVRLDEPVNSKYDDFGIVNDPLLNQGYFSSNRGKTIDIYHYKSNQFQFWFSETQKEDQYCITISDTGAIIVDTLKLQYVWDFGNDPKIHGTKVNRCFPGPGRYKFSLDLIDRRTGNLFLNKLAYDFEFFETDQPFITSPHVTAVGEIIDFDGLKSFCPGYEITGFFWDFGDGTNGAGERVSHKFIKTGEFDIKMGLTLKSGMSGDVEKRVVSKKIMVLQKEQERNSTLTGFPVNKQVFIEIRQLKNIKINQHYSVEEDYSKDALFHVVIKSSNTRTDLTNSFFRNVPEMYNVKELFDSESGNYSYIVDQQMSLMAAYPAFSEMITAGYSNAIIRTFVIKDPAEKELFKIIKNYGVLTDTYFDTSNRLSTSAYIMLDQVGMLMSKYPLIKLEIGVHTDNQGVSLNNLSLSQVRAQIIANYLVNRGINIRRLIAKGYGGTRPVASNNYPTDRRLNRRIEFIIGKE